MSRNSFGLTICTIYDYVPNFQPGPPGYVGKHRKVSRTQVVLSVVDDSVRLRWNEMRVVLARLNWRDIQAYAITLAMTSGLMGLILGAAHTLES